MNIDREALQVPASLELAATYHREVRAGIRREKGKKINLRVLDRHIEFADQVNV